MRILSMPLSVQFKAFQYDNLYCWSWLAVDLPILFSLGGCSGPMLSKAYPQGSYKILHDNGDKLQDSGALGIQRQGEFIDEAG